MDPCESGDEACEADWIANNPCAWSDDECWEEYYTEYYGEEYGAYCDYDDEECWAEYYGEEFGTDGCASDDTSCQEEAQGLETSEDSDDGIGTEDIPETGETGADGTEFGPEDIPEADCADDDNTCWDDYYATWYGYVETEVNENGFEPQDIPEPDCADDDEVCWTEYYAMWYPSDSNEDFDDLPDLSWEDAKALLGDFDPCADLDETVAGDCRYYFDSETDPCIDIIDNDEAHQCYESAMSYIPEDVAATFM